MHECWPTWVMCELHTHAYKVLCVFFFMNSWWHLHFLRKTLMVDGAWNTWMISSKYWRNISKLKGITRIRTSAAEKNSFVSKKSRFLDFILDKKYDTLHRIQTFNLIKCIFLDNARRFMTILSSYCLLTTCLGEVRTYLVPTWEFREG